MKVLLEKVKKRLDRKLKKAEGAYVQQFTEKITQNCEHSGRRLSQHTQACKLKCQGADEETAMQCWDEKARGCSLFKLKKTPVELRQKFRSLPEKDIALRWPSLGSLMWVKHQIEERLKEEQNKEENSEQRKVG